MEFFSLAYAISDSFYLSLGAGSMLAIILTKRAV